MDPGFKFRSSLAVPVRETLKEVDSNTWLIGNLLLRRSSGQTDTATWFDEEDNSSYTITDAPTPPPAATLPTTRLHSSFDIYTPPSAATLLTTKQPLVVQTVDQADCIAIWHIGNNAVCKVRLLFPGWDQTSEDVTLKWLQDKRPFFRVPEVLHSSVHDNRRISFRTRLPGPTLDVAWSGLSMERRHYYVKVIADIVKAIAEWKGDKICSVDGKMLWEPYLLEGKEEESLDDYTPENLERLATSLGMDCSKICFYNSTICPESVVVNGDHLEILDWELTGFYPRDWIRTKFLICGDHMLPEGVGERSWYAKEVWKLLGAYGFEDHKDACVARMHARHAKLITEGAKVD